eukprot:CAMPEP_0168612292 /NCGR_PEP_ID=MMETSP0449_2-20121227/2835_1 /TAXON_ID=1082188 /ORGANISM="Strombidium rassoulzadegani, Strain ras09" /LENGTH=44 /DNA_ID= /DNA_START= /DNA_END= /DNA_ORIENTATION=
MWSGGRDGSGERLGCTWPGAELRCHPSRSVRIWERWLDIKAEVA